MPAIVERLGVRLRARGAGPDPGALLGLALRNNPRRAQLLVSRVLGKHVPTDPRVVHAAGLLLGALVADALAGCPPRTLPVDLLHDAVRGAPGAAGALHVEARAAVAPEPGATERQRTTTRSHFTPSPWSSSSVLSRNESSEDRSSRGASKSVN